MAMAVATFLALVALTLSSNATLSLACTRFVVNPLTKANSMLKALVSSYNCATS